MPKLEDYPFEIRPMTPDEGTGYLIIFTEFNECFSDGQTVEETIENGMDALKTALFALEDTGLPVASQFLLEKKKDFSQMSSIPP